MVFFAMKLFFEYDSEVMPKHKISWSTIALALFWSVVFVRIILVFQCEILALQKKHMLISYRLERQLVGSHWQQENDSKKGDICAKN